MNLTDQWYVSYHHVSYPPEPFQTVVTLRPPQVSYKYIPKNEREGERAREGEREREKRQAP